MGATVRLERLYTLRVSYRELWAEGDRRYGVMEGSCEGVVSGRFVGANHARIGVDGVYLPDVQGFITTDGGAKVLFDLKGRGVIADGDFHLVSAVTHLASDERYARLNDVVCAGEASSGPDDEHITVDVYKLVWEQLAE